MSTCPLNEQEHACERAGTAGEGGDDGISGRFTVKEERPVSCTSAYRIWPADKNTVNVLLAVIYNYIFTFVLSRKIHEISGIIPFRPEI